MGDIQRNTKDHTQAKCSQYGDIMANTSPSINSPVYCKRFFQNEISLEEHFLEKPEATFLIRIDGEKLHRNYRRR